MCNVSEKTVFRVKKEADSGQPIVTPGKKLARSEGDRGKRGHVCKRTASSLFECVVLFFKVPIKLIY